MKSLKKLFFADDHHVIRNILSAALYCIALFSLDMGFRYIYGKNVTTLLGDHVPMLFTLCWIVLLTSISFLLPRLIRRIYLILTAVAYAALTFAHAMFLSFNGIYVTIAQSMFAGDGAAFFDWSYFAISKRHILLIIAVVFLSVISALIIPKTKYSIVRVVCAILAFAAGIAGIYIIKDRNFTEEGALVWDSARTPVEIYDSFNDTIACMHMVGLYQYTFRDIANVTGLTDLADGIKSGDTIEELDSYYENREIDPDNEMTGIFEGKNLIFIQLESIDTWMVNDISMPFFTEMAEKGMDFENFYAPKFLSASTFNTETIANTGLVTPMNSGKVSYFTDNYYPYSAPNLFKSEGYTVESFHRSSGAIYNRGDSHKNWGYTAYNSYGDMNMRDANLDTEMMQGYDKIVKDEPFMSFIITYSGHGPYNGESVEVERYYDIIKAQVPEDAEEEYIWALCHAYETDQFLKMLYEQLKADGKLEDTVFVMYSDHYDHYVSDESLLQKYKGGTDHYLWCNIPFVIYCEGYEPVKIDKVISSFDILPTVVNLFNLDTDGRYYVGNDAFSENGGYAFFQNTSWIDSETYFNVETDPATEFSKKRCAEINERLNISWDAVKTDYFAKKDKE